MIETIELTKVYNGRKAVDRLNLYLEQGESVGLLGPNGAGKSTAISMISTLIRPTSGDVRFQGKSIVHEPDRVRRFLGLVPQELALYEDLTAYENLKFFGRLYGLRKDKLEMRIRYVLDQVGLAERQRERIKTYSGGMKRRINIAAALMHEPEMVIMDEPTVGIDPQSRNHILETVRRLNRENGMTVLYTSHYMEEVEQLCDRIFIMDRGRVIAYGTKEELKSILSGEDTIRIEVDRAKPELADGLREIAEIRQVTGEGNKIKLIVPKQSRVLGKVFHCAEKYGVQLLKVHVETPTLEDVFLHLTGRQLRD